MKYSSVTISKDWFEEIKTKVSYKNTHFFEENGREKVEVDVDIARFDRVSAELGWI